MTARGFGPIPAQIAALDRAGELPADERRVVPDTSPRSDDALVLCLSDRVRVLEEALANIIDLENTDNNEWDGIERVIPEMCEIARAALARVKP